MLPLSVILRPNIKFFYFYILSALLVLRAWMRDDQIYSSWQTLFPLNKIQSVTMFMCLLLVNIPKACVFLSLETLKLFQNLPVGLLLALAITMSFLR